MYNIDDSMNLLEDDFNFNDQSIKSIDKNGETVTLKPDEIINPFYVNVNGCNIDSIPKKDLYMTYTRVLVLCPNDNNVSKDIASNIFAPILNKETFIELAKYFTLLTGSRTLINNNLHYKQAILVDKIWLNPFNHQGIDLNNDEIVVPILFLKQHNIKQYLDFYESSTTFNSLVNFMNMCTYFNCRSYKSLMQRQLLQITNNIKESEFWTHPRNCDINL